MNNREGIYLLHFLLFMFGWIGIRLDWTSVSFKELQGIASEAMKVGALQSKYRFRLRSGQS